MATDQKRLPCPQCGKTEHLTVYEYDGAYYVECNNGFNTSPTPCLYRSYPAATSRRYAIRFHNEAIRAAKAA